MAGARGAADRATGAASVRPDRGRAAGGSVAAAGSVVPLATAAPGRELPRLLMLGPVEVENAAELGEQTKLGQLTELAMYIALNPGCDSTSIDEAIWPGSAVTKTTRGTAISKLRRWLGTDAAGASLLPRTESGYTLRPGIRSDWDEWCDLVPDGPARAGNAELRTALDLVSGRPFSGRGRRRYAWADHLAQEMIASIVDACHEVALRSLVDGDAWEALRAALLGLSVEPGVELLWRDRLKAEAALGDRDRLLGTIEKLRATAADLGGDLEAETEELIERLRTGGGSGRGRGGDQGGSGEPEAPGGPDASGGPDAPGGPSRRPADGSAGSHGPGRPRSTAGR
ncbi:AfsR/SARP family transcriptional regulator [Jiangella muralis]|uniref:AfsR/SARP family transcriptional regulator n=1 Tax=Jiangella muralis TaxID=702383 RepID=UPI0012F83715|nr:bacterial transcriptional activator domain-containing protein [Jiangella muralis]